MARLGERLRKSQLLPSAEFIQIIYTVQECITCPSSTIPPIRKLREKYAYNVCPCAEPEEDDVIDAKRRRGTRPCPKPSRGGAFDTSGDSPGCDSGGGGGRGGKVLSFREKERLKEARFTSGQRNPAPPDEELNVSAVKDQVKLLREHYNQTARQPATVRCNINLAPPQARVTCPQTRYGVVNGNMLVVSPLRSAAAYGPDVPDHIVEKSKVCVSVCVCVCVCVRVCVCVCCIREYGSMCVYTCNGTSGTVSSEGERATSLLRTLFFNRTVSLSYKVVGNTR